MPPSLPIVGIVLLLAGAVGAAGADDWGDLQTLANSQQHPNRGYSGSAAPASSPAGAAVGAAAGSAGSAGNCGPDVTPISAPDATGKVDGRSYPSIFEAWQPASNISGRAANLDAHALVWSSPQAFGLRCMSQDETGAWVPQKYPGLCTGYYPSLQRRGDTVMLAEVRWYDAWFDPQNPARQYYPAASTLWMGTFTSVPGTPTYSTMANQEYRINYKDPCFLRAIVLQCQAAVRAGFDGCMFDRWSDRDVPEQYKRQMITAVRAAIGGGLIIVNSNGGVPAEIADVNGVFAEGFGAGFFGPGGAGGDGSDVPYPKPEAWQYLIKDLQRLKQAKTPQINAIEGWGPAGDERYRRALTTLVIIYSNAYVLYSRPNHYRGGPDHDHVWNAFWTPDLGKPTQDEPADSPPGVPGAPGVVYRQFSNGIAVYNPAAAPASIPSSFWSGRMALRTSRRLNGPIPAGADLTVPAGDGDILLK